MKRQKHPDHVGSNLLLLQLMYYGAPKYLRYTGCFYLLSEIAFRILTLMRTGQEMGMIDTNTDVGPSLILECQVNCSRFPFFLMEKAWYLGKSPVVIQCSPSRAYGGKGSIIELFSCQRGWFPFHV